MRLLALALVVGLAGVAEASPLEPLWEVPFTGNCDSSVFALDGQLAMLREQVLVPLDRATGKLGTPRALRSSQPNVQHGRSWATPGNAEQLEGVMIVRGGGWVGGFDPKTGAELWSVGPDGLQQPEPRQIAVVMERREDAGLELQVLDPHTGKLRWQSVVHGISQQFHNLTADAAHVYVITTPTINTRRWFVTALAIATGKIAWTYQLDAAANGEPRAVASDASFVLEAPGEGLRVLDPATGAEGRRIATPTVKRFAIAGGRAIAALVTKASDFNAHAVAAYDLASGQKLWSTEIEMSFDALVADDTSVFLAVYDQIHALDLATGADAAQWSMAAQSLVYVHADASVPAVILCGGGRLVALDPSGPARAVEHATIDATITCRGCTKGTPSPTDVYVDGTPVPLVHHVAHGVVDARGQITVHAEPADMREATGGIRWEVHECDRTIALTGRKHYAVSCVIEVIDRGEM